MNKQPSESIPLSNNNGNIIHQSVDETFNASENIKNNLGKIISDKLSVKTKLFDEKIKEYQNAISMLHDKNKYLLEIMAVTYPDEVEEFQENEKEIKLLAIIKNKLMKKRRESKMIQNTSLIKECTEEGDCFK